MKAGPTGDALVAEDVGEPEHGQSLAEQLAEAPLARQLVASVGILWAGRGCFVQRLRVLGA